ncbi:patatin-like phospholipase family protein [Anaeromyxobacter dehalogenans]|uniref:patatin-like phospholipase family protein n=1 Tax=Anaeromyxobacter dehalogenans TaxID=161493 RepID=UPI00031B7AEA|nr:patatin-like phospholipase family protein [Anaeromyxobacter dehalogenans]
MLPRRAALVALGLALAAPARAGEPAPGERPASAGAGGRPDDLVAFTVSGGVSLGAYEAGLSWATVRYLATVREGRAEVGALFRPRLAAVTGTSAGAVNALLAAAIWCARPERAGDVDDNLLLSAWIHLDFDELLPRSAGRYRPGDGLLSAAPLERTGALIRSALFGPGAAGAFRPGCRVPLGIAVTQADPRQRDVAGLTTSTQRLVLPWRLDVGPDGAVAVVRQALLPGELSESVLELDGVPAPGEAAPFRPQVVEDALLASAAVPMAFAPRRLCSPADDGAVGVPGRCHDYVDGGVFDNAPIGLAVDLVDAAGGGSVLHPVVFFLVDPELRRLRPPRDGAVEDAPEHFTLGRHLRLFGRLLATARSAELSRTIGASGWNRTTQRVLRDFAEVAAEFAELSATSAAAFAPARPPRPPAAGGRAGAAVSRAAYGRALSACVDRLAAAARRGPGEPEPCVAEVTALTLAAPAAGDAPLPPAEVVRLADGLAALLRDAATAAPAMRAAALRDPGTFEGRSTLVASVLLFLADEAQAVSASGLPEEVLHRFRAAVLEPIRRSDGLTRTAGLLLAGLLDGQLERLAAAAPPEVAAEARRARARLAALPGDALLDVDALQETVAASSALLARGAWDAQAMTAAWRGVLGVLGARNRFLGLSARVAALRADAVALADRAATERRLVAPSRFAPLAGAQLSGFAGFLDRPLRRYDYYAGVYEAAHGIAVAECAGGPPEPGDAGPVRLRGRPAEIDLTAAASQRCIGQALRRAVDVLGVRASPYASQVVARLAELELGAWLGRSTRAQLLRQDPSWSWLDALAPRPAPPGDPVLATLDALTARRMPCRPGDAEALCPAELGFGEFLDALSARGYRAGSEGLRLAMRDPDAWWADTLDRLAARALAVERTAVGADPGPLSGAMISAFGAAELLSRREAERGPTPRLVLDPSTLPAAAPPGQAAWRPLAARLVPYRLSLDVSRGGFGLAWLEPEVHLRRWLSIATTLEPVAYRAGHDTWSSAAGAVALGRARGFSFGAGPRWWADWDGPSGLGVEVRLAAVQDRFAVIVGVREPGARSGPQGWFVALSVADLNGLAYWLSPLGAGPSGR